MAEIGETKGTRLPKGVHSPLEATSTAGEGAQRVGIYLPGVWRFKGAAIKNPNSAVLERSRIMIQWGGSTTFDPDKEWFPLYTGECDEDLEMVYAPEDKILRWATIYGEVFHLAVISHILSVVADKIGEGDEQLMSAPKPVKERSLLG